MFEEADADHSGSLSASELLPVLQKAKELLVEAAGVEDDGPVTQEQADDALKTLDKDGDGSLNVEEFTELVSFLFNAIFDVIEAGLAAASEAPAASEGDVAQ